MANPKLFFYFFLSEMVFAVRLKFIERDEGDKKWQSHVIELKPFGAFVTPWQ